MLFLFVCLLPILITERAHTILTAFKEGYSEHEGQNMALRLRQRFLVNFN